MSKFAVAVFLIAALAPGVASACSNLSLGNVAVKNMTSDGNLNHYQINGVVTNNGASQASSTLQAVDVFKGPVKLDSKSVPPLKAGQSFTFTYVSDRSSDAGKGTSHLHFVLDAKNGSMCSTASSPATLTF
jgi:subtilase family serine protease